MSSTFRPPFSSQTILSDPPTASDYVPRSSSPHRTVACVNLRPLDSLPTIAGQPNNRFFVNDDIHSFLLSDLDLSRLNWIHAHLWQAGRAIQARPLHRYQLFGYEILGIQQMDLHLLKSPTRLMVKPLPEWILFHGFWMEHICEHESLHASACGFLLSYVWLITTPLDLKIAHENSLLPKFVTWYWWRTFVKDFVGHIDINTLHQVNKRYRFGDLRVSRLNSIYRVRYASTHAFRGYLYGDERYVPFFERNFSWVLIPFVFSSVVLSAMQVGLDALGNNQTFLNASYGVTLFSMICVLALVAPVAILPIFVSVFNKSQAISIARKDRQIRRRRHRERLERQL